MHNTVCKVCSVKCSVYTLLDDLSVVGGGQSPRNPRVMAMVAMVAVSGQCQGAVSGGSIKGECRGGV